MLVGFARAENGFFAWVRRSEQDVDADVMIDVAPEGLKTVTLLTRDSRPGLDSSAAGEGDVPPPVEGDVPPPVEGDQPAA